MDEKDLATAVELAAAEPNFYEACRQLRALTEGAWGLKKCRDVLERHWKKPLDATPNQ